MGTFFVHRSNRVERLVAALASELERPRGSAFAQEAVVVPGRGMGVWLSMELSKRLGVWATPLVYPRAFVEDVARRVLGQQALGTEPLSEELLEWALHAVLPGLLGEPDFAGIARYLAQDPHGVRRAELCARLATVFDGYLTYRPAWARAWAGGGNVNVGPEDRFQPRLFRRALERLRCHHVGELEPALLERLLGSRELVLPPRVSVLGVSTLPPLFVRVFVALSRHIDVHFYLFAPSPELEPEPRPDARRPLLAGLGQVGVELEAVLSATLEEQGVTAEQRDLFEAPPAETLLGALQKSLFDPNAPPAASAPLDAGESIAVHSCHGPAREVEALHDQLLALMTRARDPVAPEDVLVLVTDIEAYAPLIEATFRRDPGDERFVPFHVSDRGSRRDSALCDVFLRVLGLVRGRVTAAELLDLLLLEAVRQRLRIDAAGADTIKRWVVESGVRWGMDAEHRAALDLPAAGGANTWRFGIQRLLLGYALPNDGQATFGGLVGYDEVEGNDAVLLGALAGFVRTLFGWLRDFERPRPLHEWSVAVSALLALLFEETPETLQQTAPIRRALAGMIEAATVAGFEEPLDIAVVRDLVERRVDGVAPERGFLAGGVTFSALVPMRSIPFRVIALLGMNDGAFPRAPRPVEFDLVRNGQNPRMPGDRSPREDDRYLFLETLAAAREKLIVTYAGKSVRDDRELAPSVCLAELIETLAGQPGTDGARARRQSLVLQHQLQGFSPHYFDGKNPRLFSYAQEHVGGAKGLVRLENAEPSFIGNLSVPPPPAEVALEDLVRFFKSPPAYLLNRRLGIYLTPEQTEVRAREPLDLDALDRWKVGTLLLEHSLAGTDPQESERFLRGKGQLPLGQWGRKVLDNRREEALSIAEVVRERRGGPELDPLELAVQLDQGPRVTGSIDCMFPGGRVVHTFSKPSARRLLELWIRHVGLAAAGYGVKSTLVSRDEVRKVVGPNVQAFRVLEVAEARRLLAELVGCFVAGQARALPFLSTVSHSYLLGLRRGTKTKGPKTPAEALASSVSAYEDAIEFDPHAPLAFDQRLPPFDAAFDADDKPLERTEFHELAARVYDPVLAHLVEGTP
ncbi:MAG TPA: exodeoxyribonuclease V subunit gamma [Polyangiaceae bacterium]|nr:exodeoxyribonuclease V subunit gamma [Polyangiaceae bacterium]